MGEEGNVGGRFFVFIFLWRLTYICHLIACWMVLDKAVGTYSI